MASITSRLRTAVIAAAIVTTAGAPLLVTGTASAAPVSGQASTTAGPIGIRVADDDDWYHWHCRIEHEWWRPGCHGDWDDHHWRNYVPWWLGSAMS
ncbi:hypothetical protein [Nocardia stercoris]|uniref:Secreted protein n=1 Tax=Nocardia stercoris TaxID=2483361 RepID=A0A3M2LCV2_9NOCA|nr:hypothetical protein [Nocardia stercoris]RMI35361.1 hypothetical protein EBN03_03525 [Nocardia stercoris]